MTLGLADELFELLAVRRREQLAQGWPEIPAWVFCSRAGTVPDPSNLDRAWRRVRRRAQKLGVRPLKLHCARHTWATFALQAGRNIRWVADQLGHADPSLTLRVYAHAMPSEETDLSFADFGSSENVSKRLYPSPADEDETRDEANYAERLARREGFAIRLRRIALRGRRPLREPPTLRFAGELCSPSARPASLAREA